MARLTSDIRQIESDNEQKKQYRHRQKALVTDKNLTTT
jgi:hypothetical protein